MSRMMGLLVVLLGPLLLVAAEPVQGGKTTILVPDPGYAPKVGDRAVLYSLDTEKIPSDLWCATTSEDCRNFIISLFVDDKDPGEANASGGEEKIVQLAPKTDVQVLARETVDVPGAQEGTPMKCVYFAIQVLSGPYQGKTLYTLDFHITRLVEPTAKPATGDDAGDDHTPAPSVPPPALTPPPLELETVDGPPSGGEDARAPLAPTPAPLPPPLAPLPLVGQEPPPSPTDAGLPAPGTVVSTPEPSIESEPTAPNLAPETPAPVPAPAASGLPSLPSPVGTVVSEPEPEPESEPAQRVADAESIPSPPQSPGPSPITLLPESKPSPAPAPLSTTDSGIKPLETSGEPSAADATPPPQVEPLASSRPHPEVDSPSPTNASPVQETVVAPARVERSARPQQPRGLISTLSAPRSAPEMLAAAKQWDQSGENLKALVVYRSLVREHPGSTQAQSASLRIKGLTETLEIKAQETRAAHVMKRAHEVEASGNLALAREYLQQIVKVYPKTATARAALEQIRAGEDENSSR